MEGSRLERVLRCLQCGPDSLANVVVNKSRIVGGY
jgi:hypothetical protein